MRKLLLTLFVVTALQSTVDFIHANESSLSNPLVESGKQWNILHSEEFFGIGNPGFTTEIIYFTGDTLINEISYSKLYQSFYKNKSQYVYIGGLRQQEGKVYFIDTEDEEKLLYNFDIEIGSVVRLEPYLLKVASIEEKQFNDEVRNVYSFEVSYNDGADFFPVEEKWIEGIGSSFGLLYTDWWNMDGGGGRDLLSCQKGENIIFQHEKFEENFMQNPFVNILSVDTEWIDFYYNRMRPDSDVEFHYAFDGDTLADGKVYWKLYCGDQFIGGIREGIDQDIYIRNMIPYGITPEMGEKPWMSLSHLENGQDYLLYSFPREWKVGEKISYGCDGEYVGEKFISEMNYVTLLDHNSYEYQQDIINTIGSRSGILSYIYAWPTNGEGRILKEYSRGGRVIYKGDLTSIDRVSNKYARVYTDASGNVVFSLDNSIMYKSIQLFDLEGRLIYSQLIAGKNESIIPGLTKGLYLYKLEGESNYEHLFGKIAVFF